MARVTALLSALAACAAAAAPSSASASAWPTPIPSGGGRWSSPGNHRWRLSVPAGVPAGATVRADVPWRRRDAWASGSGVDAFIVASGAGDAASPLVAHCARNASSASATRASFTFTADAGAGDYLLYYLPFSTCEFAGGGCQYSADVAYDPPTHCGDAPWWPAGAAPAAAAALAYEAVTPFDAMTDMERPASPAEYAAFLAGAPAPLRAVLIAEAASNATRIWGGGGVPPFCDYAAAAGGWFLKTGGDPSKTSGWDHGALDRCCSTDPATCVWFSSQAACEAFDPSSCRACGAGQSDLGCPAWPPSSAAGVPLPAKYLGVSHAELASWRAALAPNTNYSFQALVAAPPGVLLTVDAVTFEPAALPGVTFSCFSTAGVDFWGRAYTLAAPLVAGLQPLWLGVAVDRGAPAGAHAVTIRVALSGANASSATLALALALTVTAAPPLADGQDAFPRLHWLDSRLGADDDSVPLPYTPLRANASALPASFSMHGKTIVIGASGLPAAISTFGASASPPVDAGGATAVLAPAGVAAAVTLDGAALAFPAWSTLAWAGNGSAYAWRAAAADASGAVTLTVDGSLDATGYIALTCTVAPAAGTRADARLSFNLSVSADAANAIYSLGMGAPGGYFADMVPAGAPARIWSWTGVNGDNGVWLGSTTGGVMFKLKGADPLWQASVPYDDASAPPPPPEWLNGGAGGLALARDAAATGYSGAWLAGNGTPAVAFRASLLVTPVHNLNLTHAFSLRYAQLDGAVNNYSYIASQGATVVNIHQGNTINPWINYPLLTNAEMRAAAGAVQALGMRFSIYNTMRELSNRCEEMFALRAFGETFVPGGDGPGADWLREHLGSDFLSAWSTPVAGLGDGFVLDAAIRVVALSRWNNFYVEAVQQMMRDFALDGIYLDEIAYDRVTMLRMRKLLDARGGVIDHHSHTGAFCNSPAMIYNEHYPFLSKLWYGEGFPYETASPAYWLVEQSGLIFGLTADMLRYPGMTPAHFKGFLFAESNRWQSGLDPGGAGGDPFVPTALWALWADVHLERATLYGWWLADTPLGAAALPAAAAAHGDAIKVTTYALPTLAVIAVASFATAPLTTTLLLNASILGLDLGPGFCLHAPALPPFQPVPATLALNASFVVPPGQGWIFRLEPC